MADMGRNTKEYPLCDPWHGEEGPRYLRTFLPAFISGLGTRGDKYGTLRDHAKGRDPGGLRPQHVQPLA